MKAMTRRTFLRWAVGTTGAMTLAGRHGARAASSQGGKRPNVLFIAVDDLRPQLGCYGGRVVKSPHIDRLAAQGTTFGRAYCQQALCSPSRISLLSGRYPATTRILNIGPPLRETLPDVVTLPQHFKNHGYFARSLGKVYHVGIDDPASWSVPSWQAKKPRYGPEGQAAVRQYREEMKAAGKTIPARGQGAAFYAGPAFEAPDVADEDLADGDIAREATLALRDLAQRSEQPFFLAIGFHNPHVPWIAPKKYWDLYDPQNLPLPDNQYPPKDAPNFAARTGADFYWYGNVPKDRKITPEFGRRCLHGYLAAVSYVDALVGRLLDTLAELKLANNTVVVFWGDHGYYMGEHGWWGGKHNNYEGATRAPLIVRVPGQPNPGATANGLVEFVDIYPSLTEICGLPAPEGAEGRSFKPLIENPSASIKDAACSWYPKGGYQGIAMRTDRWRFVRWRKRGVPDVYELYDHQADPAENQNLAGKPEYETTVQELAAALDARFD